MANQRNFVVLDTETTGLSPTSGHEIVTINAIAIHRATLKKHHAGEFSVMIKPEKPELAEAKAIEILGPTWKESQEKGVSRKLALQKLIDFINEANEENKVWTKPILVGHNIAFDRRFLEYYWLSDNIIKTLDDGDDLPYSHHSIDTHDFAFALWESDPSVENFKLDTLLRQFKMQRKDTKHHNSKEDVELTAKIFVSFLQFFREVNKRLAISE